MASLVTPGAVLALHSTNSKTGPAHVLYLTQRTCPDTCGLRGSTCYAEHGPIGMITRRLAAQAADLDHLTLAHNVADLIYRAPVTADLRLFAVGDAHCSVCAGIIARACLDYQSRATRHNYRAWGYTHNWRNVNPSVWHGVSMRASCETPAQAREALALGYRAALIVSHFERPRAYRADGLSVLPCLEQTRGVQCIDCRWCIDRPVESVIAFEAHGARRARLVSDLAIWYGGASE